MNTFTKIIITIIVTTLLIIGGYFIYYEYLEWKALRTEAHATLGRMNNMMDSAEGAMKGGEMMQHMMNMKDMMQGMSKE